MTAIAAFLLAFPALFSIVNPIGGALIYSGVTTAFTHAERVAASRDISLYALLVMLGALWGGAYVLNFFGISLGALRIAGGIVVALNAWEQLTRPEKRQERKQAQAEEDRAALSDMAFFPLTMPLTTGPGTIAVAVTLGSERPPGGSGLLGFFVGVSAAAAAIALMIWLLYRSADRIGTVIGVSAQRSITRLSAFLLLCIGVQIALTGIEESATAFLATLPAGAAH